MLFSEELINQYINYMRRIHEVDLTESEANEHLNSLSSLYIALSGVSRQPSARHLGAGDGVG
jgi:hypothetical protein